MQTILMIDNYDSFTFNLVHYFEELNCKVIIFRNNEINSDHIKDINPNGIVISPGPKAPIDAGNTREIIEFYKNKLPILGVCLGHQAIGEVFGATIIKAPSPMHGKISIAQHNSHPMFNNIPKEFKVTRYHSLVIDPKTLSFEFEITAISQDDNSIMAIAHKTYPLYGVQFHPESITSEFGHKILENFLLETKNYKR